jgi:hypothetical protein
MGLDNEFFISELIKSGSKAITSQNEDGTHRFSTKGDSDGVISSYLEKPKYNEEQVSKSSTSTEVTELLRTLGEPEPETVLKTTFDSLNQEFDSTLDELARVQQINIDLQGQISSLTSTNQTLQGQIDALNILIEQLRNSLQSITNQLTTTLDDKNNLTVENAELKAEIARLKALLEGKIAELKGKEEMIATLQATLASGAGSAGEEVDGLGGYIQIDETEVYVKFDGDEVGGNDDFIKGSRFYADQRDNGKANGRVNQIDAPNLIRIKNNTDEPKEMQFFENWLNSDRGRDYEKYKQPIEVFVIGEDFNSKYTNRKLRKFTIPPRTELVSQVVPQDPKLFSTPYGIGRQGGKVTRHQGDFEVRNLTDNKVKKFKMAIRRDYS